MSQNDSVFMRELKRLQQALYQQDPSIFSAITSFFAKADFAAGKNSAEPALMIELLYLAEKVLLLAEGQNDEETLTRSAKMLGTLQLTVPVSNRRWREVQFCYKPLYRSVLTLRLLSHLLRHNKLHNSWVKQHYAQRQPDSEYCPFRLNVQIPLIIAVLLLDSGQLHPQAAGVLAGQARQLDPLRSMSADERLAFLQASQTGRIAIAEHALIVVPSRAGNLQQQQQDIKQQQQRLQFIRQLLLDLDNPESELGNLLKVPQVYSSIVLPGRNRFVYEALPKAALLLKEGVSRRQYSASFADQLLRITGIFPQGYGIAFVPTHEDGTLQEKYELAVVNRLYPPKPEQPLCRIVTRNLQYRRNGHDCQVSVEHNLYFKAARDKLAVMPEARLEQILSKLSADWQPGQLRRQIPRCWHPEQFFSQREHQNLWNTAPLKQN